jgi:hypothetical protein
MGSKGSNWVSMFPSPPLCGEEALGGSLGALRLPRDDRNRTWQTKESHNRVIPSRKDGEGSPMRSGNALQKESVRPKSRTCPSSASH